MAAFGMIPRKIQKSPPQPHLKICAELFEPVLARYGSTIEYWQLGGDTDTSFANAKDLPETIKTITKQFDQLGRNSKIGVQWPWPAPSLIPDEIRNLFTTIGNEDGLDVDEIQQVFSDQSYESAAPWTMLRPLSLEQPLKVLSD